MLGIGGDHIVHDFFERPGVADLLQAFARGNRLGRISGLKHLRKDFLGDLAVDFSFGDHLNQTAQVFGAHRRIGDLLSPFLQQRGQIAHHPIRRGSRIAGNRGGLFKIIGGDPFGGQDACVVFGQAILADEALAAIRGQFGHMGANTRHPGFADAQRNKVRLGEIAVIVGVLLAAHGHGFASLHVEQARFLGYAAAGFNQLDLPFDFMIQRHLQETEGVQVLHFRLGAEFFRAVEAHADVGVTAQMALFHVATGDVDILQNLLQLGQEREGFGGTAKIGLGDDFDQRRTATVQVDIGIFARIFKPVVDTLAGVIFHVDAGDADALPDALHLNLDIAVLGKRLVVLRDLIALGKVGIKIVLAREYRFRIHRTVQRQSRFDAQFHGLAAQYRQRAGQAEANRAHIRIGRRAEAGGASAKNLGSRGELDVNLQPDHRFIFRNRIEGRRHESSIIRGPSTGGRGVG